VKNPGSTSMPVCESKVFIYLLCCMHMWPVHHKKKKKFKVNQEIIQIRRRICTSHKVNRYQGSPTWKTGNCMENMMGTDDWE